LADGEDLFELVDNGWYPANYSSTFTNAPENGTSTRKIIYITQNT